MLTSLQTLDSRLVDTPGRSRPGQGEGPRRRRLAAFACGLLLLVVAGSNYLLNLNEPRGPIWDENYYLTAAARYAQGRAQFASHPPLGLMLIAAGNEITGANRRIDLTGLARFKAVTNNRAIVPATYQYWGVRLAPALFGVAIVATVYALLLAAGIDVFLATATALLVAFETAFVVQFRAAQLDAFQIEFALICMGFTVTAARRPAVGAHALSFAAAGAAAGAATMVKLDGVLLLAAPAALIGSAVARGWRDTQVWRAAVLQGLACAAAALVVIVATYAVQTLWSFKPPDYGTPAGAADARFISPTYRDYLDGQRSWSPAVVFAAAHDSFSYMLRDQATVPLAGPNGSSPWLQPFGLNPITYRRINPGRMTGYVQLVANPVNWTLSGLGLLAASLLVVAQSRAAERFGLRPGETRGLLTLVTTALVFYVVHGLLGAHRIMYLYHYFLPELLGVLCLPFLFQGLARRSPRWRAIAATCGLVAASAVAFLWFAPVLYAHPISHRACERRNIPVWIVMCWN